MKITRCDSLDSLIQAYSIVLLCKMWRGGKKIMQSADCEALPFYHSNASQAVGFAVGEYPDLPNVTPSHVQCEEIQTRIAISEQERATLARVPTIHETSTAHEF